MKNLKVFLLIWLFILISSSLNASFIIHSTARVGLNNNVTVRATENWINDGEFNANESYVILEGDTDSFIFGSSEEYFDNLGINKGSGANVILDNNIVVGDSLKFISGNLITGLNNVTLDSLATINGEDSTKYLIGELYVMRHIGLNSSTFGGIGVTLGSGSNDIGNVSVIRTTGIDNHSTINGIESIDRKWNISSSAPLLDSRGLTLSWNSADDNSSNLNFSKIWQSYDGSLGWQALGEETNTSGTRTITVPVTAFKYFTISSTSTINLDDYYQFDEGSSLIVDFEEFISNLDNKDNKVGKDIIKSDSVSISGLDELSATIDGLVVEFTPNDENWFGTDTIRVSIVENSKTTNSSMFPGLSYFDDTLIIVNAVNDAPLIVSQFPSENFATKQDSLTNMSIEVDDIDNLYHDLSFTWEIDSVNQDNNDSLFSHTFSNVGNYEVKAFISDGLLTDSISWSVQVLTTSIEDPESNNLPKITKIFQNYPNPFNPETIIDYQLHENSPVEIVVYNQKGEMVRRLFDNTNVRAGRYSIIWDGKDDYGSIVSAGLYFYSLRTKNNRNVKRAIIVK